jgi:hypothetical protein
MSLAALAAALIATKSAEGFAGEAGKSAWTKIHDLCTRLRSGLSNNVPATRSLDTLECEPTDSNAANFARILQPCLAEDLELAADVRRLTDDLTGVVSNRQYLYVAGNINKLLTFNAAVHIDGNFIV